MSTLGDLFTPSKKNNYMENQLTVPFEPLAFYYNNIFYCARMQQ